MIRERKDQGYTIMELLVAMAIVSIVMAAIISAYQLQVRSKNTQEHLTDMNQTARAALEIMTHEIRTAGCDPNRTANAGILINNNDELSFTMDIGNGGADPNTAYQPDGDTDDPNERVRYAINADGHLGRDTGGGLQPLARNVDALNFVYLDENGNVTATPADVRSIQVAVVARAGQAATGFVYDFTDDQAYQNLQGQVIFGPANDNFRRLLLTTTIACYNMAN